MNTAILLLVVKLMGWTAALNVYIMPEHEHLRDNKAPLTVMCLVDAPITHCQFRVSDEDIQKPVVDLSSGRLSWVRHFTYEGDGLSDGHCGATITPAALPDYWHRGTVQCRVRSNNSDWVYDTMSVFRTAATKIPLTIESRLVVVRPGGDVNLHFQAKEPLTSCHLTHPHQGWIDLSSRTTCVTKADSVCYHGRELRERQCGVITKNITDRSNGMYWFHVGASYGYERTHVQVIVTKPPSTPVLSANTTIDADGITTMRAVCTVVGSRPAANVTWVLDEEVVTGGEIDYLPSDTWVRQYEEQNSTQQLTLRLSEPMNGKHLSCVVRHVAMSSPISSNRVEITVPKPPSTPILSANTTVNADGTTTLRAVCTVVGSRPAANVTWVLDGEVVTGGEIDYFPSDTWVRQYEEQNSTQQLTLKLSEPMNGKHLSCVVRHVALSSPISSNGVEITIPSAAMVDNRVRLSNMAEPYQIQMQAEQTHARVEEDNAMAATENALAAQAHTRAEEAFA